MLLIIPSLNSQQSIHNGSFEGYVSALNSVPPFWDGCSPSSLPDIQPLATTKRPSDGNNFVGLAVRGKTPRDSSLKLSAERIGQDIDTLIPGFEYLISLQLTYDRNHQSDQGEIEGPGKLNIYIGDGKCFDSIPVWTSPIIDHDDWKTYERNYVASCFNNYIILEAAHGDILEQKAAYLMVDNVSIIPVNNAGAIDSVVCVPEVVVKDTLDPILTPEDSISQVFDECKIFVPNSFTPDGDGINDIFKPYVKCTFTNYEMTIFNRWGQKLFQTGDPESGWSGQVQGNQFSEGIFLYQISYSFLNNHGTIIRRQFSDLLYLIR